MTDTIKSKVKLSAYCITITVAVLAGLLLGLVMSFGRGYDFFILLAILVSLIVTGLFYCPVSIDATSSALVIRRFLKSKEIPYSQISSAERCMPTAGGLRLCGSGGFLGFWGYFSDIVIGTYFGYYGDRTKCILLKLKSGKQYVVSCEAPDEIIAAIRL